MSMTIPNTISSMCVFFFFLVSVHHTHTSLSSTHQLVVYIQRFFHRTAARFLFQPKHHGQLKRIRPFFFHTFFSFFLPSVHERNMKTVHIQKPCIQKKLIRLLYKLGGTLESKISNCSAFYCQNNVFKAFSRSGG